MYDCLLDGSTAPPGFFPIRLFALCHFLFVVPFLFSFLFRFIVSWRSLNSLPLAPDFSVSFWFSFFVPGPGRFPFFGGRLAFVSFLSYLLCPLLFSWSPFLLSFFSIFEMLTLRFRGCEPQPSTPSSCAVWCRLWRVCTVAWCICRRLHQHIYIVRRLEMPLGKRLAYIRPSLTRLT